MRDLGILSPKWDVFTKLLCSRLRELSGIKGRKIERASGDEGPQGNSECLLNTAGLTHMNSETVAACQESKPEGVSILKRELDKTQNLSPIDKCSLRNLVFSNGVTLGIHVIEAPWPLVGGQPK